MRKVVALALDGLITYDLTCAVQAFRYCPGKDGAPLGFRFDTCGVRPGPVASPDGFELHVEHGLAALADADIVIVPGRAPGPVPDAALEALRAAAARGATMVSICIGAYVLAEAGLLDGRPATTHWAFCDDFAARYPAVRLDPGALYVDDGDVLTSAGLSAGWDLCLHIVRKELGAAIAAELARWNVRPPHREGGQAQYLPNPRQRNDIHDSLAPTLAWAAADPAVELAVPDLARHALMSERTFIRKFKAEVGTTPRRWLDAQRAARARELLETTDLPVEVVAAQAGFGSVTALRAHLRAATGATPAGYRRSRRR
ncbi:GlxA family transcriptional regulator [Nocardia arthritidis]|uniref:Helix-turn-helix domain-containing protein n=1 Tax=Nocardia arthritidis TaxID=228602 RepID=A0A6G9YTV2_9NOCA|nr:helix-turn-helix domain-containing protein [Nocardia arthritidis]QIS16634.1 helix-turn-helix domain-containing protein [Nocardia arthritidis]